MSTTHTERVYLDHNATSPLRPQSRSAIVEALDQVRGNPSSIHREGRAAQRTLEHSRERIAALASAAPRETILTSGGTEAVSAAIRGICDRAPEGKRRIVVGSVEHSAVLETARHASRVGFVVVRVPCDSEGRIDVEQFTLHLGDDAAVAALQWANNETGVLQPVEEVGRACRRAGVPFVVDAVQAAGKVPLDGWRAFADALALSAHKIGGPQGVGALVVREGVVLAPLVAGGAQEVRRRGGTPSVALAAGFAAAAEEALDDLQPANRRLLRLRARIETRLRERFDGLRFHGQAAARVANTVNFALSGVPGEMLVIALDLAGFATSTGSACASGAVEPSHVILAMGYPEVEARGAVRISLGWSTTDDDVERFLVALPQVAERVREGLGAGR